MDPQQLIDTEFANKVRGLGGETAHTTFFLPLPAPLPVPDGATISTLSPSGGPSNPKAIGIRFWQVTDHGLEFTAAFAAMSEAVLRAIGRPVPPNTRTLLTADAPSLDGIRTVAEVTCQHYYPEVGSPLEELTRVLEISADAVADVSRALRATVMAPFEIVSLASLPAFVLCDVHADGETSFEPRPCVNSSAAYPHREIVPLDEPQLAEAELRHKQKLDGLHSHNYRESFAEALVALHLRGDTAAAVIWSHIAVEVLLDAVLISLLWEIRKRPREAAEVFEVGLRERVRTQFQSLLGGDWDLASGPMAAWASPDGLARLRGRVVHSGYRPTRNEARQSLDTVKTIESFLMGRVRARRDVYPRTTMLFAGREKLVREGLMSGRFESFVETKANLEPLWTSRLARWTRYTNAVRAAGGGLTGDERCLVHLAVEPTWWLWDPMDESVCPAPQLASPDLLASIVELARSQLGDRRLLLHVPGLLMPVDGSEQLRWRSTADYDLPDLPAKPTSTGLPPMLAEHPEYDALILASLSLPIAECQLNAGESSAAEDAVRLALERVGAVADDHLAGLLAGAAGALCLFGDLSLELRREAYALAVERLGRTTDRVPYASSTFELAVADMGLGQPQRSRDGFRAALDIYRELGDTQAQARVLGNLGTVEMQAGNHEEAHRLQTDAATMFFAVHDLEGLAKTSTNMAHIKLLSGKDLEADEHYLAASRLFARSYEPLEAFGPVAFLAGMAVRDARVSVAASIVEEAAARFTPIEAFDLGAQVVDSAQSSDGPWPATGNAVESIHECIRLLRANGQDGVAAQMLIELARRAIDAGDTSSAQALEATAEEAVTASGSSSLLLDHLDLGARIAAETRGVLESVNVLDRLYETALQVGDEFRATSGAIQAATLLLNAGHADQAKQWLGEAERHVPEGEEAMRAWIVALGGAVLEHQGDPEGAAARWRDALEGLGTTPHLYGAVERWLMSGTADDDSPGK